MENVGEAGEQPLQVDVLPRLIQVVLNTLANELEEADQELALTRVQLNEAKKALRWVREFFPFDSLPERILNVIAALGPPEDE